MIRIHVICEGQTEEGFVNNLLREPFANKGIALYPSLIGKPGHKGGNFKIERLLNDLRNRLLGDTQAYCTTFFDYYGLPMNFPGKSQSTAEILIQNKAETIYQALNHIIETNLGIKTRKRFIPYVQMHEFEGLLFSEPKVFAHSINYHSLIPCLEKIRSNFNTPEDINDSPQTAPSKQIQDLIPEYEKPIMGTIGALEIGLPVIRKECRLFDQWLRKLENLTPE